MIKATQNDQEKILRYLEPHVEECVYLYLDIYQYGIGSDMIEVWYEPDEESYKLIVMKYFNCFQVFSQDNGFDPAELVRLSEQYHIDRIFARRATIEYILPYFNNRFFAEFGKVVEMKKHRDFSKMYDLVETATVEDIPELVQLLLTDEENAKSYSYEELAQFFKDLYASGIGKSFILRQDGRIVATVTISARTDIFIVGAYTMVHKDYRNTLFGSVVDSYIINVAKGEHRFFGFITEPRRIRMFQALGNPVVAEYGKLIAY